MRAIDVRYNLEYVGFKVGMDRYSDKQKLKNLKGYTKEEIMSEISGNGCPCDVEYILKKINMNCINNCQRCWRQKI